MTQIAKLFMNGRSQAVRLPASMRFEGCDEVYVRQDPETGDVILSRRPGSWDDFLAALERAEVPDDFLDPETHRRERHDRDPFEGWSEDQ